MLFTEVGKCNLSLRVLRLKSHSSLPALARIADVVFGQANCVWVSPFYEPAKCLSRAFLFLHYKWLHKIIIGEYPQKTENFDVAANILIFGSLYHKYHKRAYFTTLKHILLYAAKIYYKPELL